jgi:septum formation protein
MLTTAGVPFDAVTSPLDEEAAKVAMRDQGLDAGQTALALAEQKAFAVSDRGMINGLILGCDQTLQCDDGTMFDKAFDIGELADQLRRLSGRTHRLFSAAAIVENHEIVWHATESARMTMRPLSDSFIADYLAREGDDLLGCVGGYKIEGRGAQLFERVEGNSFVVQGMPLLPLLGFLRQRGIILS